MTDMKQEKACKKEKRNPSHCSMEMKRIYVRDELTQLYPYSFITVMAF